MKLLANENFPLPSVESLCQEGHDVLSMSERSPGLSDERVLALAHEEHRLLLTFDRDYGRLVFARRLASPPAVVFLRFRPQSPVEPAELVKPVLALGEGLCCAASSSSSSVTASAGVHCGDEMPRRAGNGPRGKQSDVAPRWVRV